MKERRVKKKNLKTSSPQPAFKHIRMIEGMVMLLTEKGKMGKEVELEGVGGRESA